MKIELKKFNIETKFNDVVKLTDDIKAFVESTGVKEGQCIIFNPHTTAGLTITSFWDPNGFEDIQNEVCRLIPTRIDFKHQHDTPTDAAGHVKSTLIGVTCRSSSMMASCCWAARRVSTFSNSTAPASARSMCRSWANKPKSQFLCCA